MLEPDFVAVNGDSDTWTWNGSQLNCSGEPTGVLRTRDTYRNFEIRFDWRHLRPGGNSGLFVWVAAEALNNLARGQLPPSGIEVQALDPGYSSQYEALTGQRAEGFTTGGDVFPVGASSMRPFSPTSPDGKRSFPRKHLTRDAGIWNRYYVRAINGEVRLWVNDEEVSGGDQCSPSWGFLCFEAEGAPIEFRDIHLRALP